MQIAANMLFCGFCIVLNEARRGNWLLSCARTA